MSLASAVNLFDIEQMAQDRLSTMARDYYASGANDEITLARNREAFYRMPLWYRVLVDVAERDAGTTVLGEALPPWLLGIKIHCR